jgi:peptidoglycan hydrolase-like protein with peptidoglycan-binding domain
VAGGLVALGAAGTPYASASPLSGPASPPSNALWAGAAHGELLGASNINTGDVVGFWQGFLASYGLVACSAVDGRFGSATVAGTKAIQGFFGLGKDGVVGPNTWAAAGAWLVWSPGSTTYDLWEPSNTNHGEIIYSHVLPSSSWKWQSPVTNDSNWHGSDYPSISFTNSGSC